MRKFIKCTDSLKLPCDVYFVVINGNNLMGYSSYKNPSLLKAERFALKGEYVELWFKHNDKFCHLLQTWN